MKTRLNGSIFILTLLATTTALAQQPLDETYTAQIKAFTTEPRFVTEFVDHLPSSPTVPTPLKFHGYIAGQDGHLTYSEDVHRYMRALEAASPRVKVLSIGKSEEGREMVVVVISSEENLAKLDRYKEITRRLSDPRQSGEEEARSLIAEGRPMYYATGALHSTETGSPEMHMELAYRLAVEETPFIKAIRDNVIVLLTPVVEVDGRNRIVDLWRYRQKNPDVPTPPLIYWGHYVAHDNNRDNISLGLNLTRNILKTYLDFHPQVFHDLHESIPFLYVSTGTGPYNPSLDPLMIDEWHRMAYHEVNELTRRGLPGVWTHGFYDGWAPNYMFWIGMGRNSIGRFYETFGNRWPVTTDRVVREASERQWFRPNPPLPTVRWSLRNNVNYQQSALLLALNDMARNREHHLRQFWTLGQRSVAKAANEGPAAWVFDSAQKRQGQLRDLMTTLRMHGIEVHVADEAFSLKTGWPPPRPKKEGADDNSGDRKDAAPKEPETVKFAKGSFIVRMDQPYSRLADTFLDVQYVRPEDRVYDDTGWTLGYLSNLSFRRVVNPEVLKVRMRPWDEKALATATPSRSIVAIPNNADTDLVRLRFGAKKTRMIVADEAFTSGGKKFDAGTVIVTLDDESRALLGRLHLDTTAIAAEPSGKWHELRAPRIAILHTWLSTQDEGWYRLAFDRLGVPYTYISTQDVAATPDLRAQFDVIVFPHVGGSRPDFVNGYPPGPPLPWKRTELTPNLGVDETDDMRPGLGLTGVESLTRFVENGGLLITVRSTAAWAVQYGLARWVRTVETSKLKAPGTIVSATVVKRDSPIAAGYDENLPIYFSGSSVFAVGYREEPRASESRPSGRGGKSDPDVPQGRVFVELPERPKTDDPFILPEDLPFNSAHLLPRPEDRPRVIVAFAKEAKDLLLSGMLEGGDEIAGKPIVIHVPRGKGNVLLFANNPMWRLNTTGSYALVFNAIMNWDRLH